MLDATEATLKQWILMLVEREVMHARVMAMAKKSNATTTKTSKTCLTPSNAAQLVQESVLKFDAARRSGSSDPKSVLSTTAASSTMTVNHLTTATVVHEWTSESYVAPPMEEHLLGHPTWRKHIPQDWETFHVLPEGWEHWNVVMPDAFVRGLVRLTVGSAIVDLLMCILPTRSHPCILALYIHTRINRDWAVPQHFLLNPFWIPISTRVRVGP